MESPESSDNTDELCDELWAQYQLDRAAWKAESDMRRLLRRVQQFDAAKILDTAISQTTDYDTIHKLMRVKRYLHAVAVDIPRWDTRLLSAAKASMASAQSANTNLPMVK